MRIRKLVETMWIAEAMLVVLAVFFGVVGGALTKNSTFAIAVGGAALLLVLHQIGRNRERDEITLAPDARRTRERRGF